MKTWAVRALKSTLASALVLLASAAFTRISADSGTLSPDQEQRMLRVLTGTPKTLLEKLPGMTPEAAQRVAAFRDKNHEFESVAQIKEVSGLSDERFDELKGAFMKSLPASETTISAEEAGETTAPLKRGAGAKSAGQSKKSKLGAPEKAATPAAPLELNLSVRAHFYSELPGYDLEGLSEAQRMAFLEAVNREMCSCGCENETLGFCLVNDPGCPVVKARVKKIYRDMVGSDPVAPKAAKNP